MGSDTRYICHCYDIMEKLATYRNDTRLVIKRGLTVREDKYSNLGVKGSKYSSILGYIDSKRRVKNFAHHKITYLGFKF